MRCETKRFARIVVGLQLRRSHDHKSGLPALTLIRALGLVLPPVCPSNTLLPSGLPKSNAFLNSNDPSFLDVRCFR